MIEMHFIFLLIIYIQSIIFEINEIIYKINSFVILIWNREIIYVPKMLKSVSFFLMILFLWSGILD